MINGLFKNWFNPNKSFFKLPVVWGVLGIITAVSLYITIKISSNLTGLEAEKNLTFIGFNNLLTYYKVPLGVFATLIPILAVLAANHRSSQTLAVIVATNEQNRFGNYFKHREEFEKYLTKNLGNLDNFAVIHRNLYGSLHDWNGNIDFDTIRSYVTADILRFQMRYEDLFETTRSQDKERLEILFYLANVSAEFTNKFMLHTNTTSKTLSYNGNTVTIRNFEIFEPLRAFIINVKKLMLITTFDQENSCMQEWLPLIRLLETLPKIPFSVTNEDLNIISEEAFKSVDIDKVFQDVF